MSNKKQVLIIVPSLQRGGGAERVAAMVGSGLNDENIEIHLITFYDFSPKYEFTGNYTSFNESNKNSFWVKAINQAKRAYKLNIYCRKHNIETAISFMAVANFSLCLSRFLFCNKCKIICSVRNNILQKSQLYQFLTRYLYVFADKIVAISRGVEMLLRENFGLENVTTIHNPIDIVHARQNAEKGLAEGHKAFLEDSFVFINIGRMTHQKGQTHLIRAFSSVAKDNQNVRLAILGDGDLRDKLEKLIAECGLQDQVHLFGNQDNVFSFLKVADQFVFSSLWEGLGNVLLESLAVGTPVISTDCVAGPREIIAPELTAEEEVSYPYKGECGLLVEPFSVDHIFVPPEEKQLKPSEQMLAERMQASINEGHKQSNPECVQQFSQDKIINRWRQLLS